jgi:hypothetical protein
MKISRGVAAPARAYRWLRRIPLYFRRHELRLERLEAELFAAAANHTCQVAELLRPVRSSHLFSRVGALRDGGYLIASDRGVPDFVISIGVGTECSADEELAHLGSRVFQFDHTVSHSPARHPNITFIKRGLGPEAIDAGSQTLSLDQLIHITGTPADQTAWLMMDAEGAEWDLLGRRCESLLRFEQVAIEFHCLSMLSNGRIAEIMLQALEKLRTSFVPVAWHPNNFAPVHVIGNRWVPDVLEVTLVRSDCFLSGSEPPGSDLFLPNDSLRPEHPEPFSPFEHASLGPLPTVFRDGLGYS